MYSPGNFNFVSVQQCLKYSSHLGTCHPVASACRGQATGTQSQADARYLTLASRLLTATPGLLSSAYIPSLMPLLSTLAFCSHMLALAALSAASSSTDETAPGNTHTVSATWPSEGLMGRMLQPGTGCVPGLPGRRGTGAGGAAAPPGSVERCAALLSPG